MLWALLLVVLVGSLGLNAALAIKFRTKMLEVADVRSDPFGLRTFARANRDLEHDASQTRIVLFGDSRIERWQPLPAIPNAEIINRGIGGQTTVQMVGRLQQDVLDLKPDLVVIQAGINDLKEIGLLPQYRDIITNRSIDNLQRMHEQLRNVKIGVVLMTTFANGPLELHRRPFWSQKVNQSISNQNQQIESWEGDGVYVFDSSEVLEDESGRVKAEYALDGLHLNPVGYAALNKKMAAFISQLVTRQAN